jgi:hypothetical protein
LVGLEFWYFCLSIFFSIIKFIKENFVGVVMSHYRTLKFMKDYVAGERRGLDGFYIGEKRKTPAPPVTKTNTFEWPLIEGPTDYFLNSVNGKGIAQTAAEMMQQATRRLGMGVLIKVTYDPARKTAHLLLDPGVFLDAEGRVSGAAWGALGKAADRYRFVVS